MIGRHPACKISCSNYSFSSQGPGQHGMTTERMVKQSWSSRW